MTQPITYVLNPEGTAAATYYPRVASFTDSLLSAATESITPVARLFQQYITEHSLESPRSVEEYTYELINLGVLWRQYGPTAMRVRIAPFRTLSTLAEWRKKHQRIKPAVDAVRGIVMSLFLVPRKTSGTTQAPRELRDAERLVEWLAATGDFREDSLRYVRWLGYWGTLLPAERSRIFNAVNEFAGWFEKESTNHLGEFTPNVDSFVHRHAAHYRWREDRFACLRSRTEYHLNMVGAEIMNRAYRIDFLDSRQKTVLVPGCMRQRSAEQCEGTKTGDGIVCSGCEPACHVNQLREIGRRHHFEVVVLPHSTDLSLWAAKPGAPSSAVVGVACLSVLVQGGWELKRYGIPAQCVLLNECGCKKHWDKTGRPTGLDVRELRRVMLAD
jgi:hypothetical protein